MEGAFLFYEGLLGCSGIGLPGSWLEAIGRLNPIQNRGGANLFCSRLLVLLFSDLFLKIYRGLTGIA